MGKVIEIELGEGDRAALEAKLEEVSRDLLSNPVIEDFRVDWGD